MSDENEKQDEQTGERSVLQVELPNELELPVDIEEGAFLIQGVVNRIGDSLADALGQRNGWQWPLRGAAPRDPQASLVLIGMAMERMGITIEAHGPTAPPHVLEPSWRSVWLLPNGRKLVGEGFCQLTSFYHAYTRAKTMGLDSPRVVLAH